MTDDLRFKVLKGHVRGCAAVEMVAKKMWSTPWAFLKATERRDRVGRLSRHGQRWWRIGCNHIGCKAEITVDETSILEKLPHG